ncbi:uncharacterized protein N7500_003162 [Penicillium coprophilum]|uniref:uncharacterized protein n=1 Tax=Penicillium coprophilum TaxID=36646 RepID=UPI0023A6DB68|nr:uncharacterized protein N7500_003162 [Penicillium coprophilum]KAJ5170379.1 hypothetical protein N7500_003162 [Penicillium coprophilum]
MAPESNEPEAPASTSTSAPPSDPVKPKLKIKGPAKVETKAVHRASEQEFLLTLLGTTKADYELAATRLGVKTPACRMRFIRLQQKYGFKEVGPKRTPRGKKEAADATNEADAAEDNVDETELKDSSNE